MKANDIIREMLDILQRREWETELVDHDFGMRQSEEYVCHDCNSRDATHKPDCRYVAVVKAAREFLVEQSDE